MPAICLVVVVLLGGCIVPFAIPPTRAEVGTASRTGQQPSSSLLHIAVGTHLASGTQKRTQSFDVGAGWIFQHDVDSDEPSTSNGIYLDGATFIDRSGAKRMSVGARGEVLWMPEGVALGAKLRIDAELYAPIDSPFTSHDKCGSASGWHIGTGAIGLFTEAGAMRMPEGTSAWTATAGLTFRLPSAVGVWVGIPWCK